MVQNVEKENGMAFNEDIWLNIIRQVSITFRLNEHEIVKLKRNLVAKLIASIPYIAKCENAEQTSLKHLSYYMIAKNPGSKKTFEHNCQNDNDIFSRLFPISIFNGGIKKIIERGMSLLALIQLEDHHHDQEIDKAEGKYNPVLAGVWDYNAYRKKLLATINGVSCPQMDRIVDPSDILDFWFAE